MTRRYLRILLVGSLLSLTACAPQSEVRQMHQSISTLNKEMTQLNQETVKITQQNKLNAESTRGVYLLPGANTPARLESQIGTLRMTLLEITPVADGAHATLRIQGESRDPLPKIQRYRRVRANSGHYGELSGGECTEPSGKCPCQFAGAQ